MKNFRFWSLISLAITSTAISSCGPKVVPAEPVIDIYKTEIKQTYQDYMQHNYYQLSACPSLGDGKLLVLPIWFTDSYSFITNDTNKQNVWDDINASIFGNNDETGWRSVKTFYEEESNNKLTITGKTLDWYNAPNTAMTYGRSMSASINIIEKAINEYFNNHPEDPRTNYDGDGDGYLDGVVVIYAAPDYSQYGFYDCSNFWAYTSWYQYSKSISNPRINAYMWASYDFMYDVDTGRDRSGTNYAYGDTRFCNIDAHTYIHECGHVLGLQDYYDYDQAHCYAGMFSMQDYNIGGHDPYSVMSLGWADPYIPTTGGLITIHSFQETHDLILLTPSWNKFSSPFDEYVLLELYTPTGLNEHDCLHRYHDYYPQGPDAIGIRVWHVDSRLINLVSNRVVIDATGNNLYLATNNNTSQGKIIPFATSNLLQLIRNDTNEAKQTNSYLVEDFLFKAGSTFSVDKFDKQFNNNGKLDNKKVLGWGFTVRDIFIDENGVPAAKISLQKLA